MIQTLARVIDEPLEQEVPSVRQQEVLSAVLDLMVEEGDGFSMAKVAKRASCSKETLYRWFGDRDGLLTATVQWQASKVSAPNLKADSLTHETFTSTLRAFALDWLTVLTGEVSIALNRLAVAHAGNKETELGTIVLENGPLAMKQRLQSIFAMGEQAGFIHGQREDMARSFFGLVVADTQVRVLLGDEELQNRTELEAVASDAVIKFLRLFGTQTNKA